MATTNETALGQTPAWTFSISQLDTAIDLLGDAASRKRDELRAAVMMEVDRYLRWTKQEDATLPLCCQKAQLTKVKNAARRLVAEVEKLAHHSDAEFAFLYQLERLSRDTEILKAAGLATSMNIDVVTVVVAWLRNGATSASSLLDRRSGPKSRLSLYLFVRSLCQLYEEITGERATHNPYLKTEYKGVPYSAAGRFVELIVRLVDPKVMPTHISTAMGYAVTERQHLRTTT
jgi:hypothetical protein